MIRWQHVEVTGRAIGRGPLARPGAARHKASINWCCATPDFHLQKSGSRSPPRGSHLLRNILPGPFFSKRAKRKKHESRATLSVGGKRVGD